MSADYDLEDCVVTREDLPQSLFPCKTERLADHNPEEVERLATRKQELLPIPADLSFPRRRQLSGLAQYGGRTLAGNRKALGNLRRRVRNDLRHSA